MRAHLTSSGQRPLLHRVRAIFLGYAVLMMPLNCVFVATSAVAPAVGAGVAVGSVVLAGWWIRGWRRGSFPAWAEPIEWVMPLAVCAAVDFDRGMAVVHGMVFFRCLFGGRVESLLRLGYTEAVMAVAILTSPRPLSTATALSFALVAALLVVAMTLLRDALAQHEQVISRERAVSVGAAKLAASSDRSVIQATAVETTAAIARSAGATGIRVLLGIGHDMRHEVVAAAGEELDGVVGHTVQFDELPAHLVAALRRGEAIYLERHELDDLRAVINLTPKRGGVLITRLRAGGRDVGALSVSSDEPLTPTVRAAVTSWSTQIAASLAGLALTEELLHRAYHDPLTGLANRELLRQRLGGALRESPEDGFTAFLLLDLDRFKQINDTFGHRAGDDVLCAVADRLRATIRPGDVAARLGGDEFAMVLVGVRDADAATAVASRLITALAAPILADGQTVTVGGSIGVALRTPGSGASIDEIVQDADAAMYRAKGTRDGAYELAAAS